MSLVASFDEILANKSGLLSNHPSWTRVELAAVAIILNGYEFKSGFFSKEKGFPLIRIRDIARNKTETYYNGPYPQEYVVRSGDLLIGMDGNFCCYQWKGQNGLLNQRVCKIIPNDRFLDKKFFLFAINGYLSAIQKATSSVTVGHLSSYDVLKIPFPLPPRNEQHRIVAKLEKLLSKVDACKERLEKIPAILKRFRQSVLAAACSGRLSEDWRTGQNLPIENSLIDFEVQEVSAPSNWTVSPLVELIDPVRPLCYGVVQPGEEIDGGVPLIRVQDMDRGNILIDDLRTVSTKIDNEYRRSRIRGGDLLVSVVGTIGRTAIIPEGLTANIARAIARVACKDGVKPQWVNIWLSSDILQTWMVRSSREVARKTLNLSELGKTKIALPPFEEQHEIVRRVETLFKIADDIEKRYQKAKAHVDKLTQSILAKAFRGELVPQDPNDEPAAELLKRIQAERKNQEAEARPGRKLSKRRMKN